MNAKIIFKNFVLLQHCLKTTVSIRQFSESVSVFIMNETLQNITVRVCSNEEREFLESIRRALHKNLYILSLKYPMQPELIECYKPDMLKAPNTKAIHHLEFYFMSILDPTRAAAYPLPFLYEPKSVPKFRRDFLNFMDDVTKKYAGYISPIAASWLVTAGGSKILKLMFEMSHLAMMVYVKKCENKTCEFDSQSSMIDLPDANTEELVQNLVSKTGKLCLSVRNMDIIFELCKNEADITNKIITDRKKAISNLINIVKRKVAIEYHKVLKQPPKSFSSQLIIDWDEHVKKRLNIVGTEWRNFRNNFIEKVIIYKNTCKEVAQRHMKSADETSVLKYDPNQIPNIYSNPALSNIIQDGVLNFSSLILAFHSIFLQNPASFSLYKYFAEYCILFKEKKEMIDSKHAQAVKLRTDMKKLRDLLEDKKKFDQKEIKITEENKWIIDVCNLLSSKDLLSDV